MASTGKAFRFLDLPAELRLRIYDLYEPEERLCFTTAPLVKIGNPCYEATKAVICLFQVNKIIRTEATHYFFSTRTLTLSIYALKDFSRAFGCCPFSIIKHLDIRQVPVPLSHELKQEGIVLVGAGVRKNLKAFRLVFRSVRVKEISIELCPSSLYCGPDGRLEDLICFKNLDLFALNMDVDRVLSTEEERSQIEQAVRRCEGRIRTNILAIE
ncbi:hypothetical protein NA57DRAFT_73322 [Rhizodiscina lignyota]|uniref:F-box domain-containing protein n=1 Tax=Rhizodiscina lignyota TaxID=1504668 RepID=A0A9P4IM10_9PEZI|nr:hypothetical protein NA57DRAFT_73322 [Rhizodiscina lignyota]